ncbi:MAG TPA: SDR family NAD(P)-dependent oxidoreductase [Acidimicrobiales bacterium]|nr:SDR family NAD(P)-dependent oxidoreductase [Acidimicrobiales bacterium]
MTGRLAGKTAVVVGGGQTPGETMGNGRAAALLFAREGAQVLVVDRVPASAEETVRLIADEGGNASVHESDLSSEAACAGVADAAQRAFRGRIDVLHHNVGIGAGDATPTRLTEDAWDRILDVNLKAMWLTCKHVVPVMRNQGGGSIVCVSSLASIASAGNLTAYKISKAGVNALVQALATTNARHNVRANAILPGFIDTPMAVDAPARALDQSRDALASARAAMVPMQHQGTAWDVAYAALYLASDESKFVTGVLLPVDGGQSVRVG